MQHDNNVNHTMGQDPGAAPGTLVGGATGMLDKLKTPVFWFAVGVVVTMFMNRKKKTVTIGK